MGQLIKIELKHLGKEVVLELNRTISSQEGDSYHNIAEASLDKTFCRILSYINFNEYEDIQTINIQ